MSIALTFLFVPADATGHFNACLGLAEQLRDRGHRVVFATPNDWKGKLEPQGFIEECYLTAEPVPEDQKGEKYNDTWGELIAKIAPTLAMSSEDQITSLMAPMSRLGLDQAKYSEPRLKEIVTKVKPDAIILDWFVQSPSLTESGKYIFFLNRTAYVKREQKQTYLTSIIYNFRRPVDIDPVIYALRHLLEVRKSPSLWLGLSY
jgi:UDP:flavonoid glycosyltransferase YjiC (YdhE family)